MGLTRKFTQQGNSGAPLKDADIPDAIARDAEVTAAIASHTNATDPHPIYLTQPEGDSRYRQTGVALADSDIPASIARDAEVTAAVAAHLAATDPHPVYLSQPEGDARYRQTATPLTAALTEVTDNAAIRNLKHQIFRGTIRTDGGLGNQVTLGNIQIQNIVGLSAIIDVFPSLNYRVTPGAHSANPGCAFDCLLNGNAVQINTTSNNSQNLVGRPFTVLVTYIASQSNGRGHE